MHGRALCRVNNKLEHEILFMKLLLVAEAATATTTHLKMHNLAFLAPPQKGTLQA